MESLNDIEYRGWSVNRLYRSRSPTQSGSRVCARAMREISAQLFPRRICGCFEIPIFEARLLALWGCETRVKCIAKKEFCESRKSELTGKCTVCMSYTSACVWTCSHIMEICSSNLYKVILDVARMAIFLPSYRIMEDWYFTD